MTDSPVKFLAQKMAEGRVESSPSSTMYNKMRVAIIFECDIDEVQRLFPGGDRDGRGFGLAIKVASEILVEVVDSGMGIGYIKNLAAVVPALKVVGKAMR